MTALDVQPIQIALHHRILWTGLQLASRLANWLSDRPKIAGTTHAHIATSPNINQNDAAVYAPGQDYGGAARCPMKPFKNKGLSAARIPTHLWFKKKKYKRLNPSWMRGNEGHFVSGEIHLARQHQSRNEVTDAIERLKARQPTALLTVDDLAAVCQMMELEKGEDEYKSS